MKPTFPSLALAAGIGLLSLGACQVAIAQQAMTEAQVRARLTAQGYTDVHDLKFKDGMWKAEADSADGNDLDVRIDASTGEIYPDTAVSNLSMHDVEAALSTQGYTDVHDVDFDEGIWKAKADNPAGKKVKLRIDAHTGKVIGIE
jgi:uncharacterized membrane protein YkoI